MKKISWLDDEVEDGTEKEVIESKSKFDEFVQSENFILEIAADIKHEKNFEIANFVAKISARTVENLNRQVKNFDAIQDSDVKNFLTDSIVVETTKNFPNANETEIKTAAKKSVEICVKNFIKDTIPIPRAIIQPTAKIKQKIYTFQLDTKNIYWQPSENILLGTELIGEKNFEIQSDFDEKISADKIAVEIIRRVISHENVDYVESAELLYSLVEDARKFFMSYLSETETNKLMYERQKSLAEEIYRQMNENFYHEEISFDATEILPFVKIEQSYFGKIKSDEIYKLNANLDDSEVPKKIFGFLKKSCVSLCKFDSNSERKFARILEQDNDVLKWLRPAAKQFDIFYKNFSRYEPDFVVETAEKIYLVEVKKKSDLQTEDVRLKSTAAEIYCETATNFNKKNGGKAWEYILLPHDEIHLNSSFEFLMKN